MERVYQATRLESGLYLQPSNDGQRIFVIARYEDGTDFGLESGPARVTRWAWGSITVAEIEQIERTAGFDVNRALWDMRDKALGNADHYATKRDATDAALASAERVA